MNIRNISLLLSLAGILAALSINYEIALQYEASSGKTKALFGLVTLISFGYRYYFVFLGVIALALAITDFRKRRDINYLKLTILLSLTSILLTILDLWRLMVWLPFLK